MYHHLALQLTQRRQKIKSEQNKPCQQFEIHTLCWAESIAKASVLNLGSLETVLRSFMQDLKIAIPDTNRRSVLGAKLPVLLPLS